MSEPKEHMMVCRECGREFDMRDLTQVIYHEVHRPIEVIPGSKGVRVDSNETNSTSNLKEGDETKNG